MEVVAVSKQVEEVKVAAVVEEMAIVGYKQEAMESQQVAKVQAPEETAVEETAAPEQTENT